MFICPIRIRSRNRDIFKILFSVNAKAPRQFGTLISTLLSLGDGWLCNNGRLVGSLLSAYFEQITILPSQLQTQILDAYRSRLIFASF